MNCWGGMCQRSRRKAQEDFVILSLFKTYSVAQWMLALYRRNNYLETCSDYTNECNCRDHEGPDLLVCRNRRKFDLRCDITHLCLPSQGRIKIHLYSKLGQNPLWFCQQLVGAPATAGSCPTVSRKEAESEGGAAILLDLGDHRGYNSRTCGSILN